MDFESTPRIVKVLKQAITAQKCNLCEAIMPIILLYRFQSNCHCYAVIDNHNEHLGFIFLV